MHIFWVMWNPHLTTLHHCRSKILLTEEKWLLHSYPCILQNNNHVWCIIILGEKHSCTCEYKLLSESQGTVNRPVAMVTALILLTMLSSLHVLGSDAFKAASAKMKASHSSILYKHPVTIQLNSKSKLQKPTH